MSNVLKIVTAFVMTAQAAWCQNIVPNPSFEAGAASLCDFMVMADLYDLYVYSWECPTNGTSDIFSSTIPNQTCWAAMPGIPGGTYKRIGSQLPRTGVRFGGIYVYGASPRNYREYLHTELTTPLVPGKSYCAEMYVSLADRVPKATNNLGMYFGTRRIRKYLNPTNLELFTSVLDASPQILETNVIQDSISWVKVSGNLLADSAYTHLTIGNFFDRENTEVIDQPVRGTDYEDRGYYFIEDVSVYELPLRPFSFEGITTICEGDTTSIKALGGLEEIKWTTLDDTVTVLTIGDVLTVKPQQTTSYRVTGTNCKLVVKDTVEITVIPFKQPNLGSDTTICVGTSLTLDAGDYETHVWKDNSTAQELIVTEPGSYHVNVENELGCSGFDEISVSVLNPPLVNLGEDTDVCDQFFSLNAGSGYPSYEWSTGASSATIVPESSGEYWVTVENRCGIDSDTISLYSFEDVYIPNVLTLNADMKNEKFKVLGLSPDTKPILTVLNRWGKEIVFRNNYNGEWPTPQESEEIPSGIYFYTLAFQGCRTYKGWLHILR